MTEKELRERAEQRLAEEFSLPLKFVQRMTRESEKNPDWIQNRLWNALLSREMENERLKEDNEHLKCLLRCDPEDRIDDGCGGVWSRTCPTCGLGTMHVNRPGEVQCDFCN